MVKPIVLGFSIFITLIIGINSLFSLESFDDNIATKKEKCMCLVQLIFPLVIQFEAMYIHINKVQSLTAVTETITNFIQRLGGICNSCENPQYGTTTEELNAALTTRLALYQSLYRYQEQQNENYSLVDFKSNMLQQINNYKNNVENSCEIGRNWAPGTSYMNILIETHKLEGEEESDEE